ncbi:MAG: hypothetical protein ABSA59_15300 [Terriglobia bacterium]
MKILGRVCLCLCILSATAGLAQDVWRSVPTVPRGPRDPDSIGTVVDAVAKRGGKESKARVVVYGGRKSGILLIGIWIRGLSEVISEENLSPYTRPQLEPEGLNPRMIEITLSSLTGKVQFNSRMVVLSDGNFPKGVDDDGSDVFVASCRSDNRCMALIHKMMEGFDQGVVWIGREVFSPPIQVNFGGKGIQSHLKTVLDFVEPAKATGSTSTK